jgi:hypothetical protein
MLAMKSASRSASSRTFVSTTNVVGSRCSSVPIASASCVLSRVMVSVISVPFSVGRPWDAARSFCLMALKM